MAVFLPDRGDTTELLFLGREEVLVFLREELVMTWMLSVETTSDRCFFFLWRGEARASDDVFASVVRSASPSLNTTMDGFFDEEQHYSL